MQLVIRRAVIALLSASATVAGLVALLAWAALHTEWVLPEPAVARGPTEVLDRHGEVLLRFTAEVDRTEVPLAAVAPVMRDAVIVAEDARFYEHEGVDPWSLVRAVVTNVRTGGITQGGSTLTQQYVKNAFVGDDQTLQRKVHEAVLAIQLERTTTKEQILERYLNDVAFGAGTIGVEAAARTYFGVSSADLDAAQAATLAQTLPAPSVRNPRTDPDGATARRDVLLERMGALGFLSDEEVRTAQATELGVQPPPVRHTDAPAFAGYVRRQLEHSFGADTVLTGSLRVTTTLDRSVQEALDDAVAAVLPADEAGVVEAAAVALDPRTGDILAIHGGRDHQLGDLDLATMARRQNGSAFKPFVYAAALEDGLVEPQTTRPAPSSVTISDCVDHEGGAITVRGGPGGRLSVHDALVRSINTTYQLLGCELGGPRVVAQAHRLGVANDVATQAAVALGGSEYGASVLDMASAFGSFANDGILCPARSITEVRDVDGLAVDLPDEVVVVPGHERRPRRPDEAVLAARPAGLADRDEGPCVGVLSPLIARQVTSALEDAVARGTGTRADIGRPQAGKTGTTTDVKDAWFVGYTPDLVLAVWIGDPGRSGEVTPMRDVLGVREVFGGTLPADLWREAAMRILADVEPRPFPTVADLEVEDGETGPTVGPARRIPAPDPEPEDDPDAPDRPVPDDEQDPSPPGETDDDDGGDGDDGDDDGDDGGGCIPILTC